MLYSCAMVFAAHPDDEIVMAGTMAKMAAAGTRVIVVQMTDGCEGYPEPDMKDTIVDMRRREAEACNKALGVVERYMLDRPDMALVNDKETLQDVIAIIRKEKPDAAFTQGNDTLHRDHRATHAISLEALWHAAGPVAAGLGAPWATPEIYLYTEVSSDVEPFGVDVRGFNHKFLEALATQESQFTLFGQHYGVGSREEFDRAIERAKTEGDRAVEHFWIAREVLGLDELPDPAAHRLCDWSPPPA